MADEFVVNDKRLFGKDGQVNPEAEEAPQPETATSKRSAPAGEAAGAIPMPPPNFTGLLLGLATSAFIHLGEGPEAEAGPVDLGAAKHAIDLLGVLQAKTQGNLEEEEASLLTTLLYDLRMKYIKASGR